MDIVFALVVFAGAVCFMILAQRILDLQRRLRSEIAKLKDTQWLLDREFARLTLRYGLLAAKIESCHRLGPDGQKPDTAPPSAAAGFPVRRPQGFR